MEFSGKELIKGEQTLHHSHRVDCVQTFEARGYTAWDPTSYAFIKDGTLCIPTAFAHTVVKHLTRKLTFTFNGSC